MCEKGGGEMDAETPEKEEAVKVGGVGTVKKESKRVEGTHKNGIHFIFSMNESIYTSAMSHAY